MNDQDEGSTSAEVVGRAGGVARNAAERLRGLPGPLIALLFAILIVVVALPEVVFLGGSLSPVGLNGVLDGKASTREVQVYPNVTTHAPSDGLQDLGARVWQLVPATKFVHRSLSGHESMSWNPYSAAGSLGPETLADLKLSPLVLAIAVLGASATAFTFVVLALVVLALYCLQRFFVRTLGLGRVAAGAACVVFLLTGFGASTFNSAVGAPYVCFPIVLYTLAEFRRSASMPRFLAAAMAYAGFILTTFVPVQLLMLVFVHVVCVVSDTPNMERYADETRTGWVLRMIRGQLLVPTVALGLTAFAWLPALDALRHAGGDIASYGSRELPNSGKLRMLKILSPWLATQKQWVGYVGIAPVMLIAAAWSRVRRGERRLLSVCVAFATLGLVLHARFPVLRLIGSLPGLRSIRSDYWAALVSAALTVAVGVAVSAIARRGANIAATTVVGLVVAFLVVTGWLASALFRWNAVPIVGVIAALALVITIIAIARASRRVSRRRILAIVTVGLVALELFSYQNHARLARFDLESPAPAYVTFLQQHLGSGRVLDAGRGALYPEWGAALGIQQIETLNVVQIPAYRRFFQRYVNPAEKSLFLQTGGSSNVPFRAQPKALDLLSVRYLVVDQSMTRYDAGVRAQYPLAFEDSAAGVRVYRNPDAFPRVYLSAALDDADPKLSPQWSMPVTHTQDSRLLAAAHAAGIPSNPSPTTPVGTADLSRYQNTRVQVSVDTTKAAILVLADSFYRNWTVTINGKAAHLGPVNAIVRGVVVPAGRSTVVFHYRSPARSAGVLVSYATIASLGLFVLVRMVRRSRGRHRRGATTVV